MPSLAPDNFTPKSALVLVVLNLPETTLPPFAVTVIAVPSSTGYSPSTKISTTSSFKFLPSGIALSVISLAVPEVPA